MGHRGAVCGSALLPQAWIAEALQLCAAVEAPPAGGPGTAAASSGLAAASEPEARHPAKRARGCGGPGAESAAGSAAAALEGATADAGDACGSSQRAGHEAVVDAAGGAGAGEEGRASASADGGGSAPCRWTRVDGWRRCAIGCLPCPLNPNGRLPVLKPAHTEGGAAPQLAFHRGGGADRVGGSGRSHEAADLQTVAPTRIGTARDEHQMDNVAVGAELDGLGPADGAPGDGGWRLPSDMEDSGDAAPERSEPSTADCAAEERACAFVGDAAGWEAGQAGGTAAGVFASLLAARNAGMDVGTRPEGAAVVGFLL